MADKHENREWRFGYDMYMDGDSRDCCENKHQLKGWLAANSDHMDWLKVEANIKARQENVHVI